MTLELAAIQNIGYEQQRLRYPLTDAQKEAARKKTREKARAKKETAPEYLKKNRRKQLALQRHGLMNRRKYPGYILAIKKKRRNVKISSQTVEN